MSESPRLFLRLARYLRVNALWWLVPVVLILLALGALILLTEPPAETMPNIYQQP